jgi:SagB-type dehydrogenase family enzyme
VNRDISAARDYHTATNHSLQSVRAGPHGLDWANQPRPFKLYANAPAVALPAIGPDSSLPVLEAICGVGGPAERSVVPDAAAIARLLHYSAGITRTIRFDGGEMAFRAAACTGALYHIELYLICGDLDGIAAGVYQFAAHDGALRQLRSGDYRGALIDATAGESAVSAAPAIIAYTTTFWRNAWKYQSRAYRHAFWDGGTIIANTLAVAAPEELPARVVLGFVDEEVNRLLDVDPAHEAAIALVAIGSNPERNAPPSPPVQPIGLETLPLSRNEIDYPLIRQMHSASSLQSTEDVRGWRRADDQPSADSDGGSSTAAAGPREPIERIIRRRGSSRRFMREPIEAGVLQAMMDAATRGFATDYRANPFDSLATPYLIVNRVNELPPGAYRWNRSTPEFELLKSGDFVEEAGYLDLGQALAADAAVNVYFLADLDAVEESFGNRGYRAAQLDAAIEAGRLYLATYALGLGATGLTFFDDDVIDFFSPQAKGLSVMFLLAAGVPARRRR